jgi:hypothetical protein
LKKKGNLINNCDFLNFTIPVSGGHCYCCQWRLFLLLSVAAIVIAASGGIVIAVSGGHCYCF